MAMGENSLSREDIPEDLWEEQIAKWSSEELKLTKNQRKLNSEFLNKLKNLRLYLGVYDFNTDFEYDRPGTAELKKFLEAYKNDRDLKVVFDLKRGESKTTVLHEVVNFNIDVLDLLLKAGANPNVQDKYGKTPLHYVADNSGSHECDESISCLLEQGARVDIQDNYGNTPLHYAADRGYVEGTELLVEKNQGINITNKDKNTALHLALYNKDVRISECILDEKREGIDVSSSNRKGWTPLLLAALLNSTSVTRSILKREANIKYTDSEGNSALHYAACNSHTGDNLKTTKCDLLSPDNDPLNSNSNDYSEDTAVKNVNELIAVGIDVNIRNKNGNTPLFFAVEDIKPEVVKQLLRQGANIEAEDKYGYTALHYAVKIRSLRMLKTLLPHQVDSDGIESDEEIDGEKARVLLSSAVDKKGNTLLHHAVKLGCSREMLNFLVKNGIDINAKNKNGVAPIHIAAKYGHEHLMDFFIENKADINVQCGNFTESEIEPTKEKFINMQDGSADESSVIYVKNDANYKKATPMSIATSNSHEDTVKRLLLQGAKPSIGNDKGWTPIHIAMRKACDKNYEEEERERAYKIIERLAVFSNVEYFRPKGLINKMIAKTKEVLTGGTQELPSLMQMVNEDRRIRDTIESALKSRENNQPSTAPVDEYAPSAPLDDSFYDKLGSYVEEIPDLYPDFVQAFDQELEENTNVDIVEFSEQKDMEEIPDNKLDKFSDRMAEDIIGLNKAVNEALELGIKIKHGFVDLVMAEVEQLNGVRENPEIASDIICKLISKGADISKYQKMNEELEVLLKNHKIKMLKANSEFFNLTRDLHDVATKATYEGEVSRVEIDNTTFYLEYLPNSIIDTAKIIDGTRDLGLNQGNIVLGGNVIKIGSSEVEIEIKDKVRNYTNLSDNSNIMLTFRTSLGELKVKLCHSMQNEDVIEVKVCDREKFEQLVSNQEEIGKNCLLGGLTVCDAIKKGYFIRSEKYQSSEIIQDISQDTEERVDYIAQGNNKVNTKNIWQNMLETKRENSCERGM